MTTEPVSTQDAEPSSPPPIQEATSVARPASNTVSAFIVSRFWWIIAGAALVKLVAYFIAPQPPSTVGGHLGGILRGFTVFGVTLAIVAGIVCLFFKAKGRIFRIVFAVLFALACLLNLPSACLLRHAYSQAHNAATEYAAACAAFEALMKFEADTFETDEYRETGRMTEALFGRGLVPERVKTGRVVLRDAGSDAAKYLNLSYCYATGFQEYPRDIPKAVQLCQRAASESYLWTNDPNRYSQKLAIDKAREVLRKSGLSWPGEEN